MATIWYGDSTGKVGYELDDDAVPQFKKAVLAAVEKGGDWVALDSAEVTRSLLVTAGLPIIIGPSQTRGVPRRIK